MLLSAFFVSLTKTTESLSSQMEQNTDFDPGEFWKRRQPIVPKFSKHSHRLFQIHLIFLLKFPVFVADISSVIGIYSESEEPN